MNSRSATKAPPAVSPIPVPHEDLSLFELTERYPDEASAIQYFESHRWSDGVVCPDCGSVTTYICSRSRRLPLHKCKDCGEQFTVTSGTIMEHTMLPLRKWLFAFHLIGASKKGIPARQLARQLKVTVKTAWHLAHRIRATMKQDNQVFDGIVESDETYIGGKRKGRGRGYRGNKIAVQTIVQRTPKRGSGSGSGRKNSRAAPVGQAQTIALRPEDGKVDGRTVGAKLRTHTDPENTVLMTDESPIYDRVGQGFAEHHTVNHSEDEYVRLDSDGHLAHTNTAEGLFANLKRQITGTHHHTSKKHLPRYLEEYDYKYNTRDQTDGARTTAAIKSMEGKRVTLFKTESGADSLYDRKKPKGKTG